MDELRTMKALKWAIQIGDSATLTNLTYRQSALRHNEAILVVVFVVC